MPATRSAARSTTRPAPLTLPRETARRLWLHAQRLDTAEPFGSGPDATRLAIEHLGYVQIDTINVIERCHHHILWSRIPGYRREHLHQAQTVDRTVFEYWTHALSYVPTRDLPFFIADMRNSQLAPRRWFQSVTPQELRRVIARVRREGAVSIRDIDDDVLVDKDHPWASRKPSKRALQLAFFCGLLTIRERVGMVKSYELPERHFGWTRRPRAAGAKQTLDYLLDRALRSQGVVSLDSVCYLDAPRKPAVRALIESRVRRRLMRPVTIEGAGKVEHWIAADALDHLPEPAPAALVHLLSPFDPLIIQRKRLNLLFGYDHRFEAYVPKDKRVFGYFALPALVGDRVAAAIDLKTDREKRKLLVQRWTWLPDAARRADKPVIEEALHRFETFQLARG
ncbi:MAG TPA: crosslink repair DNA glycosylase YcaQ family protein [Burkholderiaceae bacterium]|nr:crosslink repair DNA glycosylase YcaQ family protein [Burkholderiaceae bacterium]